MNYLSQLAARTLHQLPSVQPRLPSRFEATQRETLAEAPAPPETATFTPGAPAITAASATVAVASAQSTLEAPHVSTVDLRAMHEIAPAPRPLLDAATISATPVHQEASRRAAEGERATPAPSLTVLERNTVTHVIERDPPVVAANLTLADHTTTLERHTLVERERILAPTPIAPVEARAPIPRATPQVTPYTPPAPERLAAPEPAPVIQVSIGRIEVRAIHAPAASAAPPAMPKPGLSLDDYLRGVRR